MTINTDKLGWLVAATLFGAISFGALSGFQANAAPKFATVDIEKVFDGSKLRETNNATLGAANKARSAAFEFIATNTAMSNADARKYADLAIVDKPTPAQTAELARLKGVGEEATRKNRELSLKTALTDSEKVAVAEYGANMQSKRAMLGALENDFKTQLIDLQTDLRDKTLERVTNVVKEIGAKQGYTVVFNTASAPYAANDLTDAALKTLK